MRIIVPYSVTGPADIQSTYRLTGRDRLIARSGPPPISDALGQLVAQALHPHGAAPERLPGGLTTRGASEVARAPADGHTVLVASDATLIINPHYFHGVQYEPRHFEAVAPLATMPFVLLAHADLPFDGPQGLIEWLKPRPGEINYGSSGDGSTGHLAGELFRRAAKVNMVHASFHGGVSGLNGLAQRQVSLFFAALPLAVAYLPNEHFKPIAVTTPRRIDRLSTVPSFGEAGLRGYEVEGWYGVFVRAGAPPVAAAWLRERIVPAMAEPATRALLTALGLEPASMTPGQFATRVNTEYEEREQVLKASRLPLPGRHRAEPEGGR